MGDDFTEVEGTGANRVLVVAEASGEGEQRDGLPLRPYMPAGGVWERTIRRLGLNREDFSITNVLRCFLSPRTSVLTAEGYRELSSLKQGDLVLTHKGRFMPIKSVLHGKERFVFRRLKIQGQAYASRGHSKTSSSNLSVTMDHRFMRPDGTWVFASDLRVGDEVMALAENCIECGSAFHRKFAHYKKSLPYCSVTCHNTFVARKAAGRISESMKEQYLDGRRDRFAVTRAANEAFRHLLSTGWRTPTTIEGQEKRRVSASLARQAMGLRKGMPWIGRGEDVMLDILTASGYDPIPQFSLEGYNFDFRIGEILVEIDGAGSSNSISRLIQLGKNQIAIRNGYKVLQVKSTNLISVLDMLENDEHDYQFIPVRVSSIEEGYWKNGWWSLEVPEDESYVAQGVINHNCRPTGNRLSGMSYEFPAVKQCSANLEAAYFDKSKPKPRVILALGCVPFEHLTGISGEGLGIANMRGYVYQLSASYSARMAEDMDLNNVVVLPTYHPSHIRRGATELFGVFARDVMRAVKIAREEDFSYILGDPLMAVYRDELQYELHPSLDMLRSFYLRCKDSSQLPIVYDLETSESPSLSEDAREQFSDTRIRQIQFSLEHAQAIAVPWQPEFMEIIAAILALPNEKVGHNCYAFDNRVLRIAAPEIRIGGKIHDTMLMWRRWQPELPANLQYCASFVQFPFAWKHLSTTNLPFYGCLTAESRVMMADGSAVMIEEVVRRKMDGPVMGMSEDGSPIAVQIIGWEKIAVPGQAWKRIAVEAVDQPLYLTPDHKVWVNGEWIEAQHVKTGDLIKIHRIGSSDLIHGLLLGDGSCDKRGRLRFTHCGAQFEYFEAKRKAMGGPDYPFSNKGYGIYHVCETWISPTLWRKKFYRDGKRVFIEPPDASLAIWYMDDGCLAKTPMSGGKNFLQPRISCQKPNSEEALNWLRENFGTVSLYRDNRGKHGGSFAFIGSAKGKFLDRIAQFVHPSMDYKLPVEWRGRYNGWLESIKSQTSIVSNVSDYIPSRAPTTRFCITVDHPTHRFFAMGGLVKNCGDVDSDGRLFRMLKQSMSERGMWEPYLQQVVELHDLPARVAANGLHVDQQQVREISSELTGEQARIVAEMETIFPDLDRTYEPAEGYKKTPKQIEAAQRVYGWESRGGSLLTETCEPTVLSGESESDYIRRTLNMVQRQFEVKVKNPMTYMSEKGLELRWCRPRPISPNSRPQIIRYAKSKKHEVPKAKGIEGDLRESLTLADIDLMYGRTHDRFYGLIGKHRRLAEEKDKLHELQREGTWARDHIHPIFLIQPDGEMQAKYPNLPAIRSSAIRVLVPAAGNLFVRWSWPKQRDRILACLAGVPDAEFVADSKDIHPVAMDGFLRGQSDRSILEDNRLVFGTSLKTVMDMRKQFIARWPTIMRWHEAIRQQAHRQNYLMSRFGEIRWFYEVYAPDGKGGMRLGDQAVAASRFVPESDAAGAQRLRLGGLQRSGGLERWQLVGMARDWLMFEVAEKKVIEHVRLLHPVLSQPIVQLKCDLPVEVEVGGNWLDMQKLRLARRQPAVAGLGV